MRNRTFLIAAALVLLVIPLGAKDAGEYTPSISVSGYAEVKLKPDIASFSVTASFTEKTTEEARVRTSALINEAVSILNNEFGIDNSDIETSYISASPEYQWIDDEKVLIGQKVSQSIDVSTRNIDNIGEIYTRLMSLDGITLSDVALDKEDKSQGYREARQNAVRDAYEKASAFAEAAGVSVGMVLSISDNSSSYAPPIYRTANLMLSASGPEAIISTPTEFYSQDITVSASVSVIYGIDQ